MIGNFIGAPIGANIAFGNTGVLAVTLDDVILVSAGALSIAATATVTLDDAILVATGALALSGAAAIVLDDTTLLATGDLEIHATEGALLDDVNLEAAGVFEFINITSNRAAGKLITTAMLKNTDITSSNSLQRQITG
jgi:hypothetical protein